MYDNYCSRIQCKLSTHPHQWCMLMHTNICYATSIMHVDIQGHIHLLARYSYTCTHVYYSCTYKILSRISNWRGLTWDKISMKDSPTLIWILNQNHLYYTDFLLSWWPSIYIHILTWDCLFRVIVCLLWYLVGMMYYK